MDITNTHEVFDVFQKHKVDGVIHLAVPGLAALGAAEDFRVNMLGLLNVLEAARQNGVKRVTFASSFTVYAGVRGEGPYKEDMTFPMTSGNPTETFKKAMEITGLHFGDRTGMEVVAGRASGIWGPLYHSMANTPSRVCHAAVRGRPVDFTGSRGGVPFADDVQDFCYVKDCAQGFQKLEMAPTLNHRIYNIGAGVGRSNGDLVAAAKKVIPTLQAELQPGANPRGRKNPFVDITRAAEDVGYKPAYSLESGVEDYITWLKDHPE
jgi:UDP-glucose 4-epimerase